MHILLTNDDGVFAPGLKTLAHRVRDRGRLTVIAPRQEQSGVGHAITYRSPIGVERVRLDGCEAAFAVDGTPADCVKFALLELLPEPPDLVLSGINLGLNLGHNIFYSGTVAAAIEGAMYGVRSVALSTSYRNEDRLDWVAAEGARALDLILEGGAQGAALAHNVNVPSFADERPEIAFTHQRSTAFSEFYHPVEAGSLFQLQLKESEQGTAGGMCDEHAVSRGMISVTPLRADLTDHASLERGAT